MKSIGQIGENACVARLSRLLPVDDTVVTGIGDDCAVVRADPRSGFDLLLTSDPVIEGVHFTAEAPAEAVGHKAIGRVLSDIAAMGGEPLWALIDVVAPPRTAVVRLERIYRGVNRLARRCGLVVVGGDTSQGKALELHVFAVGRVPRGRAVLRSGAKPGDRLYVTGTLGGSMQGKHLRFAPRLSEGQWLRAHRWATAMMDVSDGLATDLRRMLAASGTGAELAADRIPVSRDVRGMPGRRSPLARALCDGEDFELLFTVSQRKAAAFEQAWKRRFGLRCTRIGAMTSRTGQIELMQADGRTTRLTRHGYEHFAGTPAPLRGAGRGECA
jgi:thiamine-monophosphate kinase